MSFWKRCLFAVISLLWGFVSMDYLIFSYRCLTGSTSISWLHLEGQGLLQIIGALLFILWFLLMIIYFEIIRRCSIPITIVEQDAKTGSQKVHSKIFDRVLQAVFVFIGIAVRFLYLMLYYLPKYK